MTPDPILRDFPDHFQTERVLIRAPRPGDGPALHEAVMESMDNLTPWMPWANPARQPHEDELWARQGAAKWLLRTDLPLLLFRLSDGFLVGGSGLHRIEWDVPCLEIGYWVRSSLEGQGYITEAVKGVTRFALEEIGAKRLEIRMDAENTRSTAVAERAGYTFEGRLRHDTITPGGVLRDTLVYALLAED